ncbi:MAG: sensor histidine kinase [Cellvibrionaceae bacterium]
MAQSFIAVDNQQMLPKIPESLLSYIDENTGESHSSLTEASVLAESPVLSEAPVENLKTAFDIFNDLSLQLADSYQHLEQRVADLSSELDSVSEQRYQELHQKEQLANKLETLINFLPGGVILLDNQGMIVESNPVAEVLLENNIKGKYWRDVIDYCFAPKDDDGHEVSNREGKRISIATRSLAEDGQIILLTDQTETRQLQSDLSRNERLSALGKMVSTLAHQVRTPLSSAMLYANHLCDNQLEDNQRQAFTQKLLNRLNYMERQVQDMLLFVKGDTLLKDRVTAIELQQSLAEAIEMPIKSYEAICSWEIMDTDCFIQCNLDSLTGALLNLVNNSLQAAPQSAITISFQQNKDMLNISVLDEGPGLSPEYENKLQEMFFTTKSQGTGIGLSVVNIVAQSHGGSFHLKNRDKGGACACLTLPTVKFAVDKHVIRER